MRILFYDLETAPTMAYVWKMWKENIAPAQVVEDGRILCWAAKWADEEDVMYATEWDQGYLVQLHELIEEADVVVTYNGNNFDRPVLNTALVKMGMPPPAPAKMVDLYQVVKRQFRFTHNRLGSVCQALGLDAKLDTGGFDLWKRCMEAEAEAFEEMLEYNIQDVVILEQLYNRLLPWIQTHPNAGMYMEGEEKRCTTCGSTNIVSRGVAKTQTQTYKRYQCNDCQSWSRERLADKKADKPALVKDATR